MERQIRYARILTLLFLIIMILLTVTAFIYVDGLAKNAIKKSVEQPSQFCIGHRVPDRRGFLFHHRSR